MAVKKSCKQREKADKKIKATALDDVWINFFVVVREFKV